MLVDKKRRFFLVVDSELHYERVLKQNSQKIAMDAIIRYFAPTEGGA